MGWLHGRKAYIWLDFNGNLACFRDTFENTADNNINEFLLNIKNLTAAYIYTDKGFMFSLNNKEKIKEKSKMHVFSVINAYVFYKQNTFATLFF